MSEQYNLLVYNLIQKLSTIQLHEAAEISLYYYTNRDKFDDSTLRDLIYNTVIGNRDEANLLKKIKTISLLSDKELALNHYEKYLCVDPSGKSVLSYLLNLEEDMLFWITKRIPSRILLSKANSFKEAIQSVYSITKIPSLGKIIKELNPEPDTAEEYEFVTPNTQ